MSGTGRIAGEQPGSLRQPEAGEKPLQPGPGSIRPDLGAPTQRSGKGRWQPARPRWMKVP